MRQNIFMKFILLIVLIVITNTNYSEANGDVSKAKIVYGYSEIFTHEDMNAAISIIKEQFIKWDGCELHSIRYTDDDYCNTEANIEWMNELAKSRGYETKFTQCIAFFSNFHSPKDVNAKTSLNIDSEYTDWSWYLARADSGDWKLMTFGY